MTHWMCTSCGYYFQGAMLPDRCPSCRQESSFNDVTCYHSECGGEHNIDPRLVGSTLRNLKGVLRPEAKTKPLSLPTEMIPMVEILKGLNDQEEQYLKGLGRTEQYEFNVVIFSEGAEARTFYLVKEGQVAVESRLTKGMLFPINIVSGGQAFGWSALVPPHLYTATVLTLSATQVIAIDREVMLHAIHTNTSFGLKIMQNVASMISSRLRSLELALVGLLQDDR
jgi:CRP/FNR family cyclic AMP-dependent transcriptional regulator